MNPYIMVLMALILLTVSFALQKLYQKKMGASVKTGLKFSIFTSICTGVIFLFVNKFHVTLSLYSLGMAALSTVLCTTYMIIGFKVMKSKNMAMYTLSLMAGGMTVPYVFGILFLKEEFSVIRLTGLLLILAAVVFSNLSDDKIDAKLIMYCAAVFVINGFVSVVLKLHQINTTYVVAPATEFVIYTCSVNVVLSSITMMGMNKISPVKEEGKGSIWFVLIIAVLYAAASGTSSTFQLMGASQIPASVLYPMITGGSIVLSTLSGILFFKEKVSKKLIICIIACFAGTCLFL